MSDYRPGSIMKGHSIQGGVVYDHLGGVWGTYDTHEKALLAVEAYKAGVAEGVEIGKRVARRAIKEALEI